MAKAHKVKELIGADTRISLFQTAMNNSGRNFEGKKVTVKKMAEFSAELYKLAIKEIEIIGQLNIKQIEKTLTKGIAKKRVKKSSVNDLMKRVYKNGKRGKKK